MELFKMFGSIFLQGGDETEKQIDNIDIKAGKTSNSLGSMAKTAAKWGAALVTAGTAAAGTLFATANKAAEATDRIDKLSQKIGISRQSFQEWDFILSQNGASVDGLQMGLKTLARAADEAAQGTATYADIFDRLNVSVVDANGNLKDQETLFNDTILALSEMENETERTALASQLLGRSAQELAPMLNSGAASVEELRAKAHELGLVLSDEAVDAGVLFTDTVDQLKRSFGAAFTMVGTTVMPLMQQFSEWIIANMPAIQENTQKAFDIIRVAVEMFATAINWARENADWLIPVVVGLVGALGALQIINVVNGLMTAWKASTLAQTLAQGGLNAVLAANPIGLVVLAIGALIAAGVALYMNWDTVKAKAQELWVKIKTVFDNMKSSVLGTWDGIVSGIKSSINKIIDLVNGMAKKVASGINAVSGVVSKIPGVNIPKMEAPQIPKLAEGGQIIEAGRVLVGEAGPEILDLPRGATVTPLSGSGVTFERGAFEGAIIFDDYGVDRLMDRVMDRLAILGVTP